MTPSRNAPCPCGSGRKFKHCHGRKDSGRRPVSKTALSEAALTARRLLEAGQYAQAEAAIGRLPDDAMRAQLEVHLHTSAASSASPHAAKEAVLRWCALSPRDPQACRTRVELGLHSGSLDDVEAAITAGQTVLARSELATHAGVLATLRGQHADAMRQFRVAVGPQLKSRQQEEVQLRASLMAFEATIGNYAGSAARDQYRRVDFVHERETLRAALLSVDTLKPAARKALAPLIQLGWRHLAYSVTFDFGRIDEGIGCLARVNDVGVDIWATLNRLTLLNYSDAFEAGDIADAHREFGQLARARLGPATTRFSNPPDPGRRLRIGFVSADFREHSVAYFVRPLLEHVDKGQFETFGYFNQPDAGAAQPAIDNDAMTAALRNAFDRFFAVGDLHDTDLVARIRADRVDVLVDLHGLTTGHRVGVFVERAAPVQVTWLGYPNTSGIDTMDYRLVDAVTDPPGAAFAGGTEELIRLECLAAYSPPEDYPPVCNPGPADERSFAFGSFNNTAKLSPKTVRLWAKVLDAVPHATLTLKYPSLSQTSVRQRLSQAFVDQGVDASRLHLLGADAKLHDHLARYHQIDLALDSYPYNGTTTNCESFLMGVPVLTLAGNDHRSRVTASQLVALGFTQLIAHSEEEYVERASALAHDAAALTAVRNNLRERFLESPLVDGAAFARDFELRVRSMWRKWCEQT
ncbi:MAG: SEC-C metal-binding domain-containing protein [Pseudomonadota bacterium]